MSNKFYPKIVYSKTEGSRRVESAEEFRSLEGEWFENPDFIKETNGVRVDRKKAAQAAGTDADDNGASDNGSNNADPGAGPGASAPLTTAEKKAVAKASAEAKKGK